MQRLTPLRAISLALCAMLAGGDVAAQFVTGRVVHAGTGGPLDAVSLELRASDGRSIARAVTDSSGAFSMQASRIGRYLLVAERIGLAPVSSEISLRVSEEVEVLLRMSESAVALEPLTVQARSPRNIGPLAGYYERVARTQRMGFGNIITRDRIDERNAMDITDLLREVPRVTIVARGGRGSEVLFNRSGGCTPQVYIDGVRANRREPAIPNELVHPLDLEGIEIYQGLAQMPGEFYDTSGCGVLLLWTRRTPDGGSPFTWKRALAGVGIFGLLLLIGR